MSSPRGTGPTVLLLRGINLGSANRVSMPALRAALAAAGHPHARTHLQSGNIVLSAEDRTPAQLGSELAELLRAQFDLDVPVVVRTRDELAAVVAANPLRAVATDPKRYQVTFLSGEPDAAYVERVSARAVPPEAFAAVGRELYGWHPAGIHSSKLAAAMSAKGSLGGLVATARNWATVEALLALCDGGDR